MARVGNRVLMQKGPYKDRAGVITAVRNKILFDIRLSERRAKTNKTSPEITITNCLEIEDFIVT